MATHTPHRIPPWVVGVGLAVPYSPPAGPAGLPDIPLLLLMLAVGAGVYRVAPRLSLMQLRAVSGVAFAGAMLAREGLPTALLPATAVLSGGGVFGIAFPWVAGWLFAEDEACEASGSSADASDRSAR